ncbi:hypothetical protein MKEN_00643900 [Mycena kentingensis (nom. inval.)]|nr:hypothetical protein MKEN_00643900 [Mycena kentingensis (nom. inval.)]
MANAVATISPFEELTKLKNTYPVTDTLHRLLEVVGHDLCDSKRNVHTLYWAADRVRSSIDEIHDEVAEVAATNSANAFDNYTSMHLDLEEFLLDLTRVTEKIATNSTTEIEDDVIFIDTFFSVRQELSDVLGTFRTYLSKFSGTDVAERIKVHQRTDDILFLRSIVSHRLTKIKTTAGQEWFTGIVEMLKRLQADTTTSDDTLLDALRVALLAYTTVYRKSEEQRQAALGNPGLKNAMEGMKSDIEGKKKRTAEQWKTTIEGVLNLIRQNKPNGTSSSGTGTKVDAPPTFSQLRPLVAQTRRPYYSQSIALVSGCARLLAEFEKNKTVEYRAPFSSAIDQSLVALTAAINMAYDPTVEFGYASSANAGLESAFIAAGDAVRACFKKYKATASLSAWEETVQKGRESDEGRLRRLSARLKGSTTITRRATEEISVLLDVEGRGTQTRSYTVDTTQSLQMLLSQVSAQFTSNDSVARGDAVRSTAVFHVQTASGTTGQMMLDPDMSIRELGTNKLGKRVVALRVPQVGA